MKFYVCLQSTCPCGRSRDYCRACNCDCGQFLRGFKWYCNPCGCECGVCTRRTKYGYVYGVRCCGCGGCFPGTSTVTLADGKLVKMSELQVGDQVQTGWFHAFLNHRKRSSAHDNFIQCQWFTFQLMIKPVCSILNINSNNDLLKNRKNCMYSYHWKYLSLYYSLKYCPKILIYLIIFHFISNSDFSSGNARYSNVRAFLWRKHNLDSMYKSITISSNRTISLTGNHLIYTRKRGANKFSAM